jgi:predicted ABC-type ATPase
MARPAYPQGTIPTGPAKPLYTVLRNPGTPGRIDYREIGHRLQQTVLRRNPGHIETIQQCSLALGPQQRPKKGQPKVTFLMGPAGSGKSTWAQERYANSKNSVILDSDIVKSFHPSWTPGSTATTEMHNWSTSIQERAYHAILKQLQPGDHIIYDGTGSWAPSLRERIEEAKAAGAFVEFAVVLVPLDVAMKRVNERVRRGGHGVPEWKIREQAELVAETFCLLAPLVNRVEIADNSAERRVEQRGGLIQRSRELTAQVVAQIGAAAARNPRKRRAR